MRVDLEQRFEVGGLREATIRGILYVRAPERSFDERAFAMLQAIRAMLPTNGQVSMVELKACLKEQYLLVRLDEERAVRAIPKLLPDDEHAKHFGLDALHRMVEARGALTEEGKRRLSRVESLFALPSGTQLSQVAHA